MGLGCDELVEFGLGCGLFVGDFVSLGKLVSDYGVYPDVRRSLVPVGCYAECGGDSFEAGEGITGECLLYVFRICHDIDSCKGFKKRRFCLPGLGCRLLLLLYYLLLVGNIIDSYMIVSYLLSY